MTDSILYSPDAIGSKPPLVKQGWLRVILFCISFLLVQGVALVLTVAVCAMFTDDTFEGIIGNIQAYADNSYFLVLSQVVGFILNLLLVFLYRRYLDRKTMMSLGFSLQNKQADSIKGFVLGIVILLFGFIFLVVCGNLEVLGFSFSPGFFALYLLLFAIVALNEEIVVRGYVLNNLMCSTDKYVALIVSSVLFSVLHFTNDNIDILPAINLVLAGILLGVYYIHMKNLWFPIMLHFSWNFFQGPVLGFEVSGLDMEGMMIDQKVTGSQLLTGGDFGFEGSLLLTVILIGASVWIDRTYTNKGPKPPEIEPQIA